MAVRATQFSTVPCQANSAAAPISRKQTELGLLFSLVVAKGPPSREHVVGKDRGDGRYLPHQQCDVRGPGGAMATGNTGACPETADKQ